MNRIFNSALCLALLGGSSAAVARDIPAPQPEGERVSDAVAKVRTKAARLDINGDGWLSENETSKGRDKLGALYGAIERKVDANRDGRVSVKEYVEAQVKTLKAADMDGDGWITRSEGKAQQRRLVMELLGGAQQ